MFIYSFKANKKAIIGLIIFIVGIVTLSVVIPGRAKSVNSVLNVSLKASENKERIAFLKNFSYDVDEEPIEIKEIIIPSEFNDTYTRYNEIQLSQGFDLEKYKGESAKLYTYAIKNYPGVKNSKDVIRANILVIDGTVIGGDICSIELNGFMHAFNGKT